MSHSSGLHEFSVYRRLSALLEQAALSGGNLVSFLLFARHVAPHEWGGFGLAYAIVLFAQGFQRAAVTIPLVPYSAAAVPWHQARARWQSANAAVTVVALAGLVAAAGAGLALGGSWMVGSAAMASLMLLPMFAHEFMRRSAIQDGRFDALVTGGLSYGLVIVLLALLAQALPPTGWLPACAVAAAAATATLVVSVRTRHGPMRFPRLWAPAADYRGFAAWATSSHLAFSGYNFGVQSILAAVAGPAAVGAFHACRILVQPINILIAATDSIDRPRAAAAYAGAGHRGLLRVQTRSLLLMSLLAVPYLLLLAIFAESALGLGLGPQYAGQAGVMKAWCVVALLTLAAQPVESGLYVMRRTAQMFAGRLLAAILALVAAFPLVQLWGATGALLAMTIGFAVAAVSGLLALHRPASGTA